MIPFLLAVALGAELSDEPLRYSAYAGATTSRAAFNDALGPGATQLFGGVVGGSLPFGESQGSEVSLHVRLETGLQLGPAPDEVRDALPDGYEVGPYIGSNSWIGAMLTGGLGMGPYLEVGGLVTAPLAWHPEFDGLHLAPGLATGGRLVFESGLLIDAGLRATTPDLKPGGSSFPVQAVVAVGKGVPW